MKRVCNRLMLQPEILQLAIFALVLGEPVPSGANQKHHMRESARYREQDTT
jgi:hypothetical protein